MKEQINRHKKLLIYVAILLSIPLILFVGSKVVNQKPTPEEYTLKPITQEEAIDYVSRLPKGKLPSNLPQKTLTKGLIEAIDPKTGQKSYEITKGTQMEVSVCLLKSGKILHIATPQISGHFFPPAKVTCERLRSDEAKKMKSTK